MVKNDKYKVEVKSYVDRPRTIVVWRRGDWGWIHMAAMAIPEDVDAASLEREFLSRL